jgi:START domain
MSSRFSPGTPLALLASSLLGLCLWSSSASAQGEPSWQKERERDGIVSYRRERPGQSLAAFRARMSIDADLWTVLAVLEDVDRASEWTAHCLEMRKLRGVSERDMLVYARTDAPWPVRDRDVVTRVTSTVLSLREVVAEIHAVRHLPERAGLVRIPALDARYAFHLRDDGKLDIEYMIEVDPGGTLPDWVKNLVGRDLAHETLSRLRARSAWARTHGTYSARALHLRAIADQTLATRRATTHEVAFTKVAP